MGLIFLLMFFRTSGLRLCVETMTVGGRDAWGDTEKRCGGGEIFRRRLLACQRSFSEARDPLGNCLEAFTSAISSSSVHAFRSTASPSSWTSFSSCSSAVASSSPVAASSASFLACFSASRCARFAAISAFLAAFSAALRSFSASFSRSLRVDMMTIADNGGYYFAFGCLGFFFFFLSDARSLRCCIPLVRPPRCAVSTIDRLPRARRMDAR